MLQETIDVEDLSYIFSSSKQSLSTTPYSPGITAAPATTLAGAQHRRISIFDDHRNPK
jgi:hypothetical protein